MLCHDQFTMEGYFKSVECLEDMHDLLRSEQLEITIWQNGRRLAYFIGNLSDVMQPTIPRLSCAHSSNVQLLMKATPAFPGILAPKVELSAQLTTQDRKKGCSCSGFREEPVSVPNRHVESRCLTYLEQPRKQQQTVCHGRQRNCCPGWRGASPECLQQQKQQERRLSSCSSTTQLSSLSQSSSLTQSTSSHLSSCRTLMDDHHHSSCDICQAYRRMFPQY